MENELIYLIGEALMLEIEEIENITYPRDYEPNTLRIKTKSKRCYKLILINIKK